MKYLVIFLILIGFVGFIIPQVFGTSENLFSGTAIFERLPVTILPNTEAKFEIKFQYTEGAYSLSNVTVIVDITPKGAASFVHFNAEPFDVYQNSIARIPVTISIDPDIEYDKIFLNISYVGTGINDVQFKSSWSDSLIFDIAPKDFTSTELPSSEDYEFERLTGARCDGEPALCYGTFYNGTTIPVQCDYRHSCGVIPFDYVVSILSPLKQFKTEIPFDDIECKENLVLVQKYDGSPACVKPETVSKLMQRGWILPELNPEPTPGPEPSHEPAPMSESETLQKQKQQQAKLHTQEVIMTDYRDPQYHIRAINDYRSEFESGYFLEQFIFSNKQNYEKDDLINFIFVEWGYQPQKCTSPKVEVYLRPYDNYDKIEKISEWQKPDDACFSISSDSDGYLIMNLWPMPIFEPYQTCTIPGEYRVVASNLEDESKKEFGYYTCQKEKLVGLPQPWMELPE